MRPARPRFRLGPRLTPAVTWLLAINVATFLLFAFSGTGARTTLAHWLILTPASLLEGHVWKLVTTTLFTVDPLAFLLDVAVLWLFMPFLEGEWGTRRFLRFAAITSIAGNVVAAGVGLLLGGPWAQVMIAGLGPFVFAAMVGFGVAFGDRPIQFFGVIPMKGRTLAIGISVVILLAAIVNRDWVGGAAQVAAMVAAVLLVGRGRITPRLWILRWRRARLRKKFTVVGGGAPEKKQWLN